MDRQHQGSITEDTDSLSDLLFTQAVLPMLFVDPLSDKVLKINIAAERLLESSAGEVIGQPLRSYLQFEHDWQDNLLPDHSIHDSLGQDGFRLRNLSQNSWIPVQATFQRIHPPYSDPLLVISLVDRREHFDTLRRLARAEAETRRWIQHVNDCLWSCRIESTGTWRYRYISPSAQRLTGCSPAVLLEGPHMWERLIVCEDLARWQVFQQKLRAGFPGSLEYRLQRDDGWIRVVETVMVSTDETGILLFGVVHEVPSQTPSASSADRLKRSNQEQQLVQLANVTGGIAHDFNNLLAGILGHVGLARLEVSAEASINKGLEQIEKISQRASELCQQLATIAGRTRTSGTTTNVGGFLRHLVEEMQHFRSIPGLFDLDLPPSLPSLRIDQSNLQHLLQHLITNAVEAIDHLEGRIVLRVREAQASDEVPSLTASPSIWEYVAPDCDAQRRGVLIDVIDNGPGISTQAQKTLCEPFSTTRPGKRGMGLAQVLGIVRSHQGSLQIRTKPGLGTQVRLFLPSGEPPASSASTVPSAPSSQGVIPCTILLADDEETIVGVTSRLLVSSGCKVIACRDGDEALAKYEEHRNEISLALIDLTMPRMGGEQTLQALRLLAPDLPLVLMSGYAEADIRPQFASIGLQGYLQKPFRLSALLEVLRSILGSQIAPEGSAQGLHVPR